MCAEMKGMVVLVGLLYDMKNKTNARGEVTGTKWVLSGYLVARDGRIEKHSIESFATIVDSVQNAELVTKGTHGAVGFYRPKGTDLKRVPRYVRSTGKSVDDKSPIVIVSEFDYDGVRCYGVLVEGFSLKIVTPEEAYKLQEKERQSGILNANVQMKDYGGGVYRVSRGSELVYKGRAMWRNDRLVERDGVSIKTENGASKIVGINKHMNGTRLGLVTVLFYDGVTTVASGAFENCNIVDELCLMQTGHFKFPMTDVIVEDSAFRGSSIRSIREGFPPVSVTFGSKAFEKSNLAQFSGTYNNVHIGSRAFAGTSNLGMLRLMCQNLDIGQYAFSGSGLTSVVIRVDGVLRLSVGAFRGCTNLKKVEFVGSGVLDVENGVFNDCKNLESIYCGLTVRSGNLSKSTGTKGVRNIYYRKAGL